MRALLLIDHGSRASDANQLAEAFGSRLAQSSGCRVFVAHMELAEPTVTQQFLAARDEGCTSIDVMPLFFAPGRHLSVDIPVLLSAASALSGLPYTLGPAMLEEPGFLAYCNARVRSQ